VENSTKIFLKAQVSNADIRLQGKNLNCAKEMHLIRERDAQIYTKSTMAKNCAKKQTKLYQQNHRIFYIKSCVETTL